jgi:anti-anti-sigma regulatory factor
VLGAVDTFVVWFFGAFRKTQDLVEWLVVPFITAFSLVVGFLNAVFLGIGISMFVFVASFFRVGVVKYNASGLEIRSRIERSVAQSAWLNENGDLCQVLVLQNYLFFGNACTVLDYIATMFEEIDQTLSQRLDFDIAPFPKILVLDLSLVTGMDTSTVDIFGEIYEFCKNNGCKLFFCGLSARMRKGLELGGIRSDVAPRSQSNVRFFADLDTALGRAEDSLIQSEMKIDSPRSLNRNFSSESLDGARGFKRALQQIDDLHGLNYSQRLCELHSYIEKIDLAPGACLYKCDGGVIEDSQRGVSTICFILRNCCAPTTLSNFIYLLIFSMAAIFH